MPTPKKTELASKKVHCFLGLEGCHMGVALNYESPSDGLQSNNPIGMASILIAMTSNPRAMASNRIGMASNRIGMASNLIAMASNLKEA